jgi:hypothetical protein
VSIVRVGLAETKGFAEGYDAIFGTKKEQEKTARSAKKAQAASKTEKSKGKKKAGKKK